MNITICTIGSRGDVQPVVALAQGLRCSGHDVRLFTHELFADLARDHDVTFIPLPGDPREGLLKTAAAEMGTNPFRLVGWLRETFRPVLAELFRLTLDALEGSDLVISSSASIAAFHVAERLGIPAISAQLQPTTVTRAFACAVVRPAPSWLPWKSVYNVWATKAGNQTVFQMLRPLTNECREEILCLPPLGFRYWWNIDAPDNQVPMIYAYSPAVLPRPADWGPRKQVSGYWFLDTPASWQPNPELVSFLEAGPPPLYVGIGSMVDHRSAEMTRVVVDAVIRTGRRAILHRGWSELGTGELPDSIHLVDDVPHDWLFPRVAAAVHHGGAGTTAAAFRAGIPSVVVPFFFDQFFWAGRIHELGAGPRWIPRKRLTAERLATAVRSAVHDAGTRARTQAIGERIRAEDGVGRAVALIERFAAEPAAGRLS
jgi:UDP:flavonoid glycosyltransferase YjiC (YdhE family)